MRFKNSLKNLSASFFSQIFIMLLSFICRTIFVRLLSAEYLGLSGLFTNILSVLALSELGIGNAIIVHLYKPIAEQDEITISRYMNFYAIAYRTIGIVILVFGVLSTPFLPFLINSDTDIPNLELIYFLYIANTAVSYFCAYKRTILTVDQKEYINTINRNVFTLIQNVLQIILLLLTQNYVLYVTAMVACTLVSNIRISILTDKMYPYLQANNQEKLEKSDILELLKSLKAILYYKLGNTIINSTDNILISTMLGVYYVGLYSNYSMLVSIITTFAVMIFAACSASLGNYNASEDEQKVYFIFRVMTLIAVWVYGFASICFACLFQPFIQLWVGEQYFLDNVTMLMVVAAFFLKGIISVSGTFLDITKLFIRIRAVPIIMAVINILVSILATKAIGLTGIFLGTIVSYIATQLWANPYILCKYRFHVPLKKYALFFSIRIMIVLVVFGATSYLVQLTDIFVVKVAMCAIVPNALFAIFLMNTMEFRYILSKIRGMLMKD